MWGKMEQKEKVKDILYFSQVIHSGESGQLNSWFNVNENVSIFFPRYLRHVVFCPFLPHPRDPRASPKPHPLLNLHRAVECILTTIIFNSVFQLVENLIVFY